MTQRSFFLPLPQILPRVRRSSFRPFVFVASLICFETYKSSATMTMDKKQTSTTNNNPLENAQVKGLLKAADEIQSRHDFGGWQRSFLDAYTQFLESAGSDKAHTAYQQFRQSSGGLFSIVQSLHKHIDQGSLSKQQASVKARRQITELGTVLGKLVEALDLILPTTSYQITKFGFTKYHMGAVLVEDGFREYAVMQCCQKMLYHLRQAALQDVAGPQVLDGMEYFGNKFQSFCGVMESLNLMNVCKIAEKFLHADLLETSAATAVIKEEEQTEMPALTSAPTITTTAAFPEKNKEFTFTVVPSTKSHKRTVKSTRVHNGKEEDDVKSSSSSVSSYEEIEETVTVSTYETVEVDEESSYEMIKIVESSEYETEEEEGFASDNGGTDSNGGDVHHKGDKGKSKAKLKSKMTKPIANKRGTNNINAPPGKELPLDPRFHASVENENRKNGTKILSPTSESTQSNASPHGVGQSVPPSTTAFHDSEPDEDDNENSENDPDSNNSSSSNEEDNGHDHKGKKGAESDASSKSSGRGNIKPKAAVAPDSRPGSPTANEKPVERIQFSAKDFYHGHGSNDCFQVWKQYKDPNNKDNDKTDQESMANEKKSQRMERRKVVANRRKRIKDRTIKTIRQKKDKPPKVVRIRRTRQVVQTKLVKKQKAPV